MATCIYCPSDATSKEHWIPRGLGTFRGYTPLIDRLCGDCNRRLGHQLDQELMRTGLTGLYRAMLNIEGRRGKPSVSAFHYRAMQAEQPTTMLMPALGRDHEVLAEAYTDEEGRRSARPIRQIALRMPDGHLECVPLPRAWGAAQLRAAVANRGLLRGVPEEVYVEDDEDGANPDSPDMLKLRRLLTDVFGRFGAQVFGGTGTRTEERLISKMGVNLLYLRALAKVAFHYFLWTCPVLRGDEDAFAAVRGFISEGRGDWKSIVEIDAPQFHPALIAGHVPRRTSHLFFGSLTRDQAVAHVQFFAGPEGVPPPSRIILAEKPLSIDAKLFVCHQASYFHGSEDGDDGHDGELIAIEVSERRIITSWRS